MNETNESQDSIASLKSRRSLLIDDIARAQETGAATKDLTRELMAIDLRILTLENSQRGEPK